MPRSDGARSVVQQTFSQRAGFRIFRAGLQPDNAINAPIWAYIDHFGLDAPPSSAISAWATPSPGNMLVLLHVA